ncbi:MAG: hypothetical protein Q9183_007141, partial [Haloplaca sp. 2 TL-2023]
MADQTASDHDLLSTTESTAITAVETHLDTQQDQAFFSLLRIGHLSPRIASTLATVYRAALAGNTFVQQQAEHHGIDSAWMWFAYSVCGYVGLSVAEFGMAFVEKLVGLIKWVLFVPMVGILVLKAARGKSLGEVVEFFFAEKKGEE